jgi:hypothetical protein
VTDTTLRDLVLKRLKAETQRLPPFAEGLELLLTGDTYRWSQRRKVWRDGWRNLHHPRAALAAEFALEGETGALARVGTRRPEPGLVDRECHGRQRLTLGLGRWLLVSDRAPSRVP